MGRDRIRKIVPANAAVVTVWPRRELDTFSVNPTWQVKLHRVFADKEYHHISIGLGMYDWVDMEGEVYMTLEQSYGRVLTDLWAHDINEIQAQVYAEGATACRLVKIDNPVYRPGKMGLYTCVSLAKGLLGCFTWNVQTPRQLVKWIDKETHSCIML